MKLIFVRTAALLLTFVLFVSVLVTSPEVAHSAHANTNEGGGGSISEGKEGKGGGDDIGSFGSHFGRVTKDINAGAAGGAAGALVTGNPGLIPEAAAAAGIGNAITNCISGCHSDDGMK
jgi:hypothetical protein